MNRILLYIKRILPNLVIILSVMFITFWILDWLNPVMDFTGCKISNYLLILFCILSFGNAILTIGLDRKLDPGENVDSK